MTVRWLELLLALYLVIVLPGHALWRSKRKGRPRRARITGYRWSTLHIGLLLTALTALMWQSGRPVQQLGLALPRAGWWGLALAVILLSALIGGGKLWERRLSGDKLAEHQARTERASESMPRTREELNAFLVLAFCIGCGWELLYRGFLMMVLGPLTGTATAVILAAVAYGAAHGYQGRGQFVGSIVSAFLFTIGYVMTDSLWWLMLIHTALPVYLALNSYTTAANQSSGGAAGA